MITETVNSVKENIIPQYSPRPMAVELDEVRNHLLYGFGKIAKEKAWLPYFETPGFLICSPQEGNS